jgi:hypothetical protein
VLSCRVMLDVPVQLVLCVARLLAAHRREIGTRRGTRALGCWRQAVFVLAWFRDRPDIPRLGNGFGISRATAYRYPDEAIGVLAARAPGLREALENATGQRLPYLILDGKVVAADRVQGKDHQQEGPRDRPLVFRQGTRLLPSSLSAHPAAAFYRDGSAATDEHGVGRFASWVSRFSDPTVV